MGARRKWALLARACTAGLVAPAAATPELPPLPAVAYLVEAAAGAAPAELPARGFYERTVRVIELFERVVERRTRGLDAQVPG